MAGSIWVYTLSGGFRSSINGTMTAYATSEFGLHSLLTVVDIVSGAMTAACYIPLAKALDLWGRAEGFMLMVGMLVLGMVLQAAAPNLACLCAGRVSLLTSLIDTLRIMADRSHLGLPICGRCRRCLRIRYRRG